MARELEGKVAVVTGCVSLNGRQPLCNGREEPLNFFPQVRDRPRDARTGMGLRNTPWSTPHS
jgi:hypothetical protein